MNVKKILLSVILIFVFPIVGIPYFLWVVFKTPDRFKERVIEGYKPWRNFKKVINENSDLIPFLWYQPKSIDDGLYSSICRTLVSYEKPSNELTKRLAELSIQSQGEDANVLSAIFLGLTLRNIGLMDKQNICDITLNKNEILYYKNKNMFLERYKTYSTNYMSTSFKSGCNGLRCTYGTIQHNNNEQLMVESPNGVLYVTSQRIIYIDSDNQKSYTIPLSSVLKWYIENDSVVVVVSGRKPYKFTNVCNFTIHLIDGEALFDDSTYELGNVLENLLKV